MLQFCCTAVQKLLFKQLPSSESRAARCLRREACQVYSANCLMLVRTAFYYLPIVWLRACVDTTSLALVSRGRTSFWGTFQLVAAGLLVPSALSCFPKSKFCWFRMYFMLTFALVFSPQAFSMPLGKDVHLCRNHKTFYTCISIPAVFVICIVQFILVLAVFHCAV